MGLIFIESSKSDPGAPPGDISDKTAHFIVYSALGAALMRAVARGRAGAMTVRTVAIAALLAVLYGISDEVHQSFVPDRTPDVMDLAADGAGGLTGAAAYAMAARGAERIRRRR
jgi:VanZ family protein